MNIQVEIDKELWDKVARRYKAEDYTDAIELALGYLRDLIRDKANVDGDGADLMTKAFGGKPPLVKVNALETESDIKEQVGFMNMLKDLWLWVRNPRAHTFYNDEKATADNIIMFIDYAGRVIGKSKTVTMDDWRKRILDKNFPPNNQAYIDHIVSLLQPKKMGEALLDLYSYRGQEDARKLRTLINKIVTIASDNHVSLLIGKVSDTLRECESKELVPVLQSLPYTLWVRLDQDARIRAEYIICQSILQGATNTRDAFNEMNNPELQIEIAAPACSTLDLVTYGGSVGTWAADFIQFFDVYKEETKANLTSKLASPDNEDGRIYVSAFFLHKLPVLFTDTDEITKIVSIIKRAILEEDSIISEQLAHSFDLLPAEWQSLLCQALKVEQSNIDGFLSDKYQGSLTRQKNNEN